MSRKAAAYLEPETSEELSLTSNKSVTIDVEIDPDNGTYDVKDMSVAGATGPVGDIYPGDILTWNFTKAATFSGTLDLKTLIVGLPRLGVSLLNPTGASSLQVTLDHPLHTPLGKHVGGRDGNDPSTVRLGVGHKLTLGGQALTRPDTRLVIDTSGPPAGSGGGQHPCPPDGPEEREDRDCHERPRVVRR